MAADGTPGGVRVARRALRGARLLGLLLCAGCLLVSPTPGAPIVVECVSLRADGTGGLRRVLRADGEAFVQALDAAGVGQRTERESGLGEARVGALHDALAALCARDHADLPEHDGDLRDALARKVAERESAARARADAPVVHRLELAFGDLRLDAEVPDVPRERRAGLGAWDRHALALVDEVLALFDGPP